MQCEIYKKELKEKDTKIKLLENNILKIKSLLSESGSLIDGYNEIMEENKNLKIEIDKLKNDLNLNNNNNYQFELLKQKMLRYQKENQELKTTKQFYESQKRENLNIKDANETKIKRELSQKDKEINQLNTVICLLKLHNNDQMLSNEEIIKKYSKSKMNNNHHDNNNIIDEDEFLFMDNDNKLNSFNNNNEIDYNKDNNNNHNNYNMNIINNNNNNFKMIDIINEKEFLSKEYQKYKQKYFIYKFKYQEFKKTTKLFLSYMKIIPPGSSLSSLLDNFNENKAQTLNLLGAKRLKSYTDKEELKNSDNINNIKAIRNIHMNSQLRKKSEETFKDIFRMPSLFNNNTDDNEYYDYNDIEEKNESEEKNRNKGNSKKRKKNEKKKLIKIKEDETDSNKSENENDNELSIEEKEKEKKKESKKRGRKPKKLVKSTKNENENENENDEEEKKSPKKRKSKKKENKENKDIDKDNEINDNEEKKKDKVETPKKDKIDTLKKDKDKDKNEENKDKNEKEKEEIKEQKEEKEKEKEKVKEEHIGPIPKNIKKKLDPIEQKVLNTNNLLNLLSNTPDKINEESLNSILSLQNTIQEKTSFLFEIIVPNIIKLELSRVLSLFEAFIEMNHDSKSIIGINILENIHLNLNSNNLLNKKNHLKITNRTNDTYQNYINKNFSQSIYIISFLLDILYRKLEDVSCVSNFLYQLLFDKNIDNKSKSSILVILSNTLKEKKDEVNKIFIYLIFF